MKKNKMLAIGMISLLLAILSLPISTQIIDAEEIEGEILESTYNVNFVGPIHCTSYPIRRSQTERFEVEVANDDTVERTVLVKWYWEGTDYFDWRTVTIPAGGRRWTSPDVPKVWPHDFNWHSIKCKAYLDGTSSLLDTIETSFRVTIMGDVL